MLLTPEEAELFFKLHRALMFFVNQQLHVLPDIKTIDEYLVQPPEARFKVHKAFLDEIDLAWSGATSVIDWDVETAMLPSSSPGKVGTKWTRPKDVVGL